MVKLKIPFTIWFLLLKELRHRGEHKRESGALLIGQVNSNKVSKFICYDDLDPDALKTGIITFDGKGFGPLWDYCCQSESRVLADVHTHPGTWTRQSDSDSANPMISEIGHFALIVPNFAQYIWPTLRGIGIHEYLGNHNWRTWEYDSGRVKLVML